MNPLSNQNNSTEAHEQAQTDASPELYSMCSVNIKDDRTSCGDSVLLAAIFAYEMIKCSYHLSALQNSLFLFRFKQHECLNILPKK